MISSITFARISSLLSVKSKLFLLYFFILVQVPVFAQPVVTSSLNLPPVGDTAPVFVSIITNGPGNAGANQVWDFSSLTFSEAALLEILNPAATPFGSTFPTSNSCFAMHITGLDPQYFYFSSSTGSFDELANNYTGPGTGGTYTNPKTWLKYPFNYGDSFLDVYQKTGQGPDSVLLTYDGYGTLKTPYSEFSNVVRIKFDYFSGADYHWFTLDPMRVILVYGYESNAFTGIGDLTTDINDENPAALSSYELEQNYPNPFNPVTRIKYRVAENGLVTLKVYDVLGKEVALLVNEEKSQGDHSIDFDASNLPSGMYICRMQKSDVSISIKMLLLK